MIRYGLLAAALCLGCGSGKPTVPVAEHVKGVQAAVAPSDPSAALYEKLRAGAYQFDAALASLEQATAAIKPLAEAQTQKETKDALQNVLALLDQAGRSAAELHEAPERAQVDAAFAAQDERRLKGIESMSLALREVREAQGTVEDMLDSQPPAQEKEILDKADTALDEADDAISEGIKALGGTPPPDEE